MRKKGAEDTESSDSEREISDREADEKKTEAEDHALNDADAKMAGRIIKDEQEEIV